MQHEIKFVEVRHQFSQDELNQFGPIIARLNQEWQDKELEKKTVMSDFKHQIDAIKEEFNKSCDKLNSGYEMREVRARMIRNYSTFEREYFSMETFDLVKKEPFKTSDYQRDIDDGGEDKPFGAATDPTPEPEGTAETNPTQYAALIRELNFWRKKLQLLPEVFEGDREIEAGLEISAKIKALETTLTAMEPEKPVVDDESPINTFRDLADALAPLPDGADYEQAKKDLLNEIEGNQSDETESDDSAEVNPDAE